VESVVSGAILKINVQNKTRLNVCSAQDNILRKIIFAMRLIARFRKLYRHTSEKCVNCKGPHIAQSGRCTKKKRRPYLKPNASVQAITG
jgi:hypothetical protein